MTRGKLRIRASHLDCRFNDPLFGKAITPIIKNIQNGCMLHLCSNNRRTKARNKTRFRKYSELKHDDRIIAYCNIALCYPNTS